MSTAVYPHLSPVNAMTIGGAKRFDAVSRDSFAAMAEEAGMAAALVLARLDGMVKRIIPAAEKLSKEFKIKWPAPLYDEILKVIRSQIERIEAK